MLQDTKPAALRTALGGSGPQGDAVLKALVGRLNTGTVKRWHDAVQQAAFGRAGVTLHPKDGNRGLELHVNRQSWGGWTVTLRERYSPDKATSARGDQPIAAGGLAMTALTWRLVPPGPEGQPPFMERIGGRAVFAL